MTIIEALSRVISSIKTWAEKKFLNKSDISAWAKASSKPSYTASEVGADISGTASSAVSTHNTNTSAHNDIRELISGLSTRLNTLANSDDTTLDQMSEIVTYIKSNKTLIDSITTDKVNVSDIINNLTTNTSSKPLSAAQGLALKSLIDAITVPTKVSQLTNDKGYITSYTETDPTVPAWAKKSSKPSYTASEVGADSAGTASSAVSSHNSTTNNHSDIRTSIQNLQAKVDDISVPTKVGQLTNDKGYITGYTETDPTVPSWAKASSKPTYSASEVGADAKGTASSAVSSHNSATNSHTDIRTSIQNLQTQVNGISVPTNVSELTNDKGYITGYTETDPTVPSWAKAASKPTYSKSEVGLGNVDNVKQYSASNPPPYPVTSVNGKTGVVTVSALPEVTTSDNGKVLMVVNGTWKAMDFELSVDSNGILSI